MTLKQLEYFLAIVEAGSVTKAADNLNMSQPPLSMQLKLLESELGVQLFTRNKNALRVTPKGLLLQKRAREIIALVSNTVLEIESQLDEERLLIRIGTVSSICNRVLPDRIQELKALMPQVGFELREGSSNSIIELLNKNEVDLGIIREPFNRNWFNTRQIKDKALGTGGTDYFAAVAAPEFFDDQESPTVSLASLKDKPLIIHRRYTDLITSACRQKGFVPSVICQNDNISSSLSWAGSGIGIAIAPYTSAIQNSNPHLLLKKIDDPTIISRAYLVWKKNTMLSDEAKVFVNLFS